MKKPREKGHKGEREFCEYLKDVLSLDFSPKRNIDQVREGGADIIDVPPFCIEVKREQKGVLRNYWNQVWNARTERNPVPFVAYRQNRKKWKFLISAEYIGLLRGFIRLEEEEFKQWVRRVYGYHKDSTT